MGLSISKTLCFIGLPLLLAGSLAAQTIADDDLYSFDDGEQPFYHGTVDGSPVTGSVQLTEDPARVHDGIASVEFTYPRVDAPAEVLLLPALLTDFTALRMWVFSENEAQWMIGHTDRDGARFLVTVQVPAGQWLHVDLGPGDFQLDPQSPVIKPAMEPERNGMSFYMLDLNSVFGPAGPNTIWIDTLEIERPPLNGIDGPVLVTGGQIVQITQPTYIDGDVYVEGGSVFESSTTRLVLTGGVYAIGQGSEARFTTGTLRLTQQYRYEQEIITAGHALVSFENLLFHPVFGVSMSVTRGSAFEAHGAEIIGPAFTAAVLLGGRIELHDTTGPGEFLVYPQTTFIAEDVDFVIVWLIAEDGESLVLDVPDWHDVTWDLPAGWKRQVSLTDVGLLYPAVIAYEGSQLLVRDGRLRVAGVIFETQDVVLDGYKNDTTYPRERFDLPQHQLAFSNVELETWNFYAFEDTTVTILNSTFGETLAFGQGQVHVYDSICDGTGGYLGARGDGTILLTDTEVRCEIVCDGDSFLAAIRGLVSGDVVAAENARIGFSQTDLQGELIELDNGTITVR